LENSAKLIDPVCGILLAVLTVAVIVEDWGLAGWVSGLMPWLTVITVLLIAIHVRSTRKLFVLVAVVLTAILASQSADWLDTVQRALATSAFIAAFYIALSTLRSAAETSRAIREGGLFLALQPPGWRYLALTVGGQLFALILNYGSIALLGSLATSSAAAEPDPEIRRHRTRRMLLAIQRAFISTLSWSPLAFSIAITTSLVPGTQWSDIVLPGLVTSFILAGTGWALDSIFKPRLNRRPAPVQDTGSWKSLLPLFLLFALLATLIGSLRPFTHVRIIDLILTVVPFVSIGWLAIQSLVDDGAPRLGKRLKGYVLRELPGFRGELTLLMMAGYIGTVGAPLVSRMLAGAGIDFTLIPAWLLLVSLVWLIPVAGQIGMNPILAITLALPVIPPPEVLGVPPTALVVAVVAGWALTGANSPFTATTLLIGSFGKISAWRVGWVWNGFYSLVCAILLSAWVVVYASL
jgi:hypothetical protein